MIVGIHGAFSYVDKYICVLWDVTKKLFPGTKLFRWLFASILMFGHVLVSFGSPGAIWIKRTFPRAFVVSGNQSNMIHLFYTGCISCLCSGPRGAKCARISQLYRGYLHRLVCVCYSKVFRVFSESIRTFESPPKYSTTTVWKLLPLWLYEGPSSALHRPEGWQARTIVVVHPSTHAISFQPISLHICCKGP